MWTEWAFVRVSYSIYQISNKKAGGPEEKLTNMTNYRSQSNWNDTEIPPAHELYAVAYVGLKSREILSRCMVYASADADDGGG